MRYLTAELVIVALGHHKDTQHCSRLPKIKTYISEQSLFGSSGVQFVIIYFYERLKFITSVENFKLGCSEFIRACEYLKLLNRALKPNFSVKYNLLASLGRPG